ncbi:uncharacterized protein C3orf14 [Xenopus laevis]|uniref:Uncharacterized protein C3orf14 n=2 Tax=Xenopus laevis TaxID=8355 RepID=A0A1L8GQ39_XENLA|nr:uncharacterized protein C3orf14 [Xenopus laevis]XP_018114708.1 uncharacterized protein C3orf14 [Xenopus laevis]OCT85977.1 hypothetical protein XELAEV_18024147mg [Xenopus laevis]
MGSDERKRMNMYFVTEAALSRRHKEIIAERAKLQEEMKVQSEQHENERKIFAQRDESANKRNQAILEDLQGFEQSLKRKLESRPDPVVLSLENKYWESVEQEIPKWERFLLGKASSPFGFKKSPEKRNHSQTLQSPRKKDLPPSGAQTLPR